MSSVICTAIGGWLYKEASKTEWKASVRSTACTQIHADLLANKEIPDPFVDMNENYVQWVGEKNWEYKSTFSYKAIDDHCHNVLVFEGLDTYATVYLNGFEILKADNMFREYRIDVKEYLMSSNTLHIVFESATKKSQELEREKGKLVCFNGDPSRLYARKAQYHYGWDWGPVLITCGPWKPVKLLSYSIMMIDVYAECTMNRISEATLNVRVETAGSVSSDSILKVEVKSPKGVVVATPNGKAIETNTLSFAISIENPELWYPVGYGEPSLYYITVYLYSKDDIIQVISKRVGMRKVELIQEGFEDQVGKSFYFKVNNIPIFSVGSNWIPAHSISTSVTEADYKIWLQLIVKGNQNMVRVWGGGYYESDAFYDGCDELGLLVWQDFMFACGQYPGDKSFIHSVTEETKTQLKRLRNHCSIVLYAGNNEDYQVAEEFHLEWNPKEHLDDYSHTTFPARTIYEVTLPKLVREYHSDVPYHPGSPWGGDFTADPTVGDIHQWNVWHGRQEKYQNWYKLGGRFITEFGMEALPSRKTFDSFITDKNALYPQSAVIDHHNKAAGFERRLALYVIENIKVKDMNLDSWIYATQLMQSECLSFAYRFWRRSWKGHGKRYIGGSIVWQINDCWPGTSWSMIDFYKRPKLAFYSVKRECSPLWIAISRNDKKEEDMSRESKKRPFDFDVWGVNSTLQDQDLILKIDIYDIETGKIIAELPEKEVLLKSNQSTDIISNLEVEDSMQRVVFARFFSLDMQQVIARVGDWPQPLKYLRFPDRKVSHEIVEDSLIKLSTNKPVKCVEIIVAGKDVIFSDNGVDLFPGDDQLITVRGLSVGDNVSLRYYDQ